MFNNPGPPGSFARLLDNDLADYEQVMAVNLFGVIAGTQRAARHMAEHGGGSVINTTSIAALTGGAGPLAYRVSKAAVIAFTKTLAREMARHHINVNCVCPGPTDTPMFAGVAGLNPRLAQALERAIPWHRLGQPEDIAGAVAFLVGPDAGYITGQTLSVSGGLTMV